MNIRTWKGLTMTKFDRVLSDEEMTVTINDGCTADLFSLAERVEQAVLQSPEIQALREDAGRMRNALNKIAAMNSMSYHSLETAKIAAKAAMEPRR